MDSVSLLKQAKTVLVGSWLVSSTSSANDKGLAVSGMLMAG